MEEKEQLRDKLIGRRVVVLPSTETKRKGLVGKVGTIVAVTDLVWDVKIEGDGYDLWSDIASHPEAKLIEKDSPFQVWGSVPLINAFVQEVEKEIKVYSIRGGYGNAVSLYPYKNGLDRNKDQKLEPNTLILQLPGNYNEALEFVREYFKTKKEEIKPGDWVECIESPLVKGSGWELGLKIKVKEIDTNNVIWGYSSSHGVYSYAVRKLSPSEIPKETTLVLGTNDDRVVITKGCVTANGTQTPIKRVETIIEKVTELNLVRIAGVDTTIDEDARFIRIGCTGENHRFSINELRQVLEAEKAL